MMGSGTFSSSAYRDYASSMGRSYDSSTGRSSGQVFHARRIDKSLDPRLFQKRECANSEEHPNTIPVILALDVTGSMGEACQETAEALGTIMMDLFDKFQDIEFCIMGIGDLAYDDAPIQMSQFESDVRIAEALDKVYMEKGGGGNGYESYTSAWYMGLHRTKLDCYDLQGRKGIIITMGDEPLNPYLPVYELNRAIKGNEEDHSKGVETSVLFKEASKKFNIFHIAVDSPKSSFDYYKDRIENSFGQILGDKLRISTIQELPKTIVNCISEAIQDDRGAVTSPTPSNPGEISW
ncbi:MAG: VWA domain-containing protein [Prevotella sp.]|nr:VWA domain-containing protein [Prevotella sp.]